MMTDLRWTSEKVARTRDGIDLATRPLSAVDRAGLEMARDPAGLRLLSEWDAGERLKTLSHKVAAVASVVGLITMPGARPLDHLLRRAGDAAGLANRHSARRGVPVAVDLTLSV
jgi:hypothetical protein